MINKRLLIFILFSVVLNACGQQGPLFMPIENESTEKQTIEDSKIGETIEESKLEEETD